MPRRHGPGFGGRMGPMGPMGPMWPMGGRGDVGLNYFRPGGPNRPAPGGHVEISGGTFTENLTAGYFRVKRTFSQAIRNKGIIGGIFLGARILTSGSLRYDSFVGKVAAYDKQKSENRITDRQCKERKMMAAKKYYRYLYKSGYISLDEYNKEMTSFANSIEVRYVNDVDQPTQGRTR